MVLAYYGDFRPVSWKSRWRGADRVSNRLLAVPGHDYAVDRGVVDEAVNAFLEGVQYPSLQGAVCDQSRESPALPPREDARTSVHLSAHARTFAL